MSDAWKAGALMMMMTMMVMMMMMMTLTVLVVYDQDVMHKYLLFAYLSHIYIYIHIICHYMSDMSLNHLNMICYMIKYKYIYIYNIYI